MDKNLRIGLIIGGIVLALLVIVPLVWSGFSGGQNNYYGGWGGMMGLGMMGGFGGLMFIPMVVVWGLIIWGVVWLVRGTCGCGTAVGSSREEHKDSAIDILKARYARGEVSKEEFEEKKKGLI